MEDIKDECHICEKDMDDSETKVCDICNKPACEKCSIGYEEDFVCSVCLDSSNSEQVAKITKNLEGD